MTKLAYVRDQHGSCRLNPKYRRAIIIVFATILIVQTVFLSLPAQDPSPRTFADFDAFYLAAQMVWRGEIDQAYRFATLTRAQEAFFGAPRFLPWTYPPQFSLFIAPLAFLPFGAAYGLFTATTLVAYLVTLKRIAGEDFTVVLLMISPAIGITIVCGQNGFLVGTLIGLTCLGLEERRASAGLPLGLMIIKPHLAVAFAVYTLITRRWSTVFIATTTVTTSSVLATALLGPEIWAAFYNGMGEARDFLEKGMYPLFRMISPYAALRSFGLSATTAFTAQVLVAVLVLAMVCLAVRRGFALRQSLGLSAIASLLISPYAYDYDLPIFGIGLALLLPNLRQLGNEREQAALYILSFLTGIFGLAQTFIRLKIGDNMALSA